MRSKMRRLIASRTVTATLAASLALILVVIFLARRSRLASPGIPGSSRQRVLQAYGKLPLVFEANNGQSDGEVKFFSRGNGYSMFLTPTETVLSNGVRIK